MFSPDRLLEFGHAVSEKVRELPSQAITYAQQLREQRGFINVLRVAVIPVASLAVGTVSTADLIADSVRGSTLTGLNAGQLFPTATLGLLAYGIQIIVAPRWFSETFKLSPQKPANS